MNAESCWLMKSVIGPLTVFESDGVVNEIRFGAYAEDVADNAISRQLYEYFAGDRKSFDVRIEPRGTKFHRDVWNALLKIPYGETRSYSEIARAIGRPAAIRAVGAANGANPIPIVIPCHRVIGSNGSLTGFGGGIDVKRRLLELEAGYRLF